MRVSLGMKKSYVDDAGSVEQNCDIDNDDHDDDDDHLGASSLDDTFLDLQHKDDSTKCKMMYNSDIEGSEILVQPGRTTCVLPLQVSLEDSEDSDVDNPVSANQDDAKVSEQAAKKDRRLKRKAKEEKYVMLLFFIFCARLSISLWFLNFIYFCRELEISASEERHLQNDMPRTEDEFEKLVRRSPNSSFVWIKYMAYMLSLADVEKARSTAERFPCSVVFFFSFVCP